MERHLAWVGVPDCPDARTSPTPNERAFQESEMSFHVTGTYKKAENNDGPGHYYFSMSGGTGWDLETDGIKAQYGDIKHAIHVPLDPFEYFDSKEMPTTVAAIGYNDFGSFVSAGYLEYCGNGTVLTLGRRYLDAKDLREKWTLEELHQRLARVDKGHVNLCVKIELDNLNAGENVRVPPWRTVDLHAEKLTRKRKKQTIDVDETQESSSNGKRPSLNVPSEGGYDSSIVLDVDETYPTNALWVEQCVGCGNALGDESNKASNLNFYEFTTEKPNTTYNVGIYCNSQCAVQTGVPALVEAGKAWKEKHDDDGYSLQSRCRFWRAVESDSQATRKLKENGWRKVDGWTHADWVLGAPVHEE
jgi:hypothetical protein